MDLITSLYLIVHELLTGMYSGGLSLIDKSDVVSVAFGLLLVVGSICGWLLIGSVILFLAYWLLSIVCRILMSPVKARQKQRDLMRRREENRLQDIENRKLDEAWQARRQQERQRLTEIRNRVENDPDGIRSTQAERDIIAAENRRAEARLEANRMRLAMEPMMAAFAAQSAAVNAQLAQVVKQLEAANKPGGPLAFSEWLATNSHVRQGLYNRLGRVLDKLDKS